MKKLILFILILSAIAVKSQTNIYHPFPDSAAFWNIEYSSGYGSDSYDENYSITFSGDTIINSTAYHKLVAPKIKYFSHSGANGYSTGWDSGYYAGSIRQDTALRTVYFVLPNDSIEWLLYDFNLEVGDTLKGYLVDSSSVTYIVQQVDSYFVDNSYRKTWAYNGNSFSLIEGIGSMGGLIERFIDMDPVASETFWVQCFVQNDTTIFPETGFSCELITNVHEKNTQQFSIAISPNPFSTYATVQLSPQFSNSEMYIYNALGVLVYNEKIDQESYHLFNRKNLPSGIYFMQFLNKKAETATLKFLVD
jgi:hypothetical protein